jgi:glycine cleavage system regulatory protein
MNIFVASRMKNIVERKAVIDVVHSTGHVPKFIEAEQMRMGKDSKNLMNEMIGRSEAFILISDDSHGYNDKNLGGLPPLLYELKEFVTRAEKKRWKLSKVMAIWMRKGYKRRFPDPLLQRDIRLVVPEKEGVEIQHYEEYDELAVSVRNFILKQWGSASHPKRQSKFQLQLEFHGLDKKGILGRLAELLYSRYSMNISYVSGSSLGGRASLIIAAETWDPSAQVANEKDIEDFLRKELEQYTKIDDLCAKLSPKHDAKAKFYFEMRVLDVPGVLSALCKALNKLNMNILDLRQRPAAREFDRQSEIVIWMTPAKAGHQKAIDNDYLRVETRLRNLVGLQALSSHIIS